MAVAAIIVAADVAVIATQSPSAATTRQATSVRTAPTPSPVTRVTPAAVPAVAPLRHRWRPDLMLVSSAPLTKPQLRRIHRTAHPVAGDLVDAGRIRIGKGHTLALGITPSTFRAFTPAGTAGVDPLWQRVASGDAALAHTVARALAIDLGGTVQMARQGRKAEARVGAFATSGLPGVGALLPRTVGRQVRLVPRAALVLSVKDASDAPALAQQLRHAVPHLEVATVQRFVTTTHTPTWVSPAAGPVTSGFGPRRFPLDPTRTDFHPGIDIAAPLGAPIWAAAAGTVLYAGPAAGFGNEIILLHADGVTTVYGHMSRLLVTSGPVRAGQPIALVGSEGESTGPHLHFEVHVRDKLVDPLQWLTANGVVTGR